MLHNSYRLLLCHPSLGAFLLKASATVDFDLHISEGKRSMARQNVLYALGRTSPGTIVTNASAGESPHNYGLAVDVYPSASGSVLNPQDDSAEQMDRFATLGQMTEDAGLVWGGNFNGLVDKPHIEVEDWRSHTGWATIAVVIVAALLIGGYSVYSGLV